MATINLLAASADIPPASEVSTGHMSLVLANRQALATRAIPRYDIAYPDDNFVWSASASDDGSLNFYAVPLKSSGKGTDSSQWDDFQSPQVSGSDWYTQNAIHQYALHASMPMQMSGRSINLYA
jgi:hypothetical protein